MAKPGANEVRTQGINRLFRQPGGAGPQNLVRYSGMEDQYLALDGFTLPIRGSVEPIRVPDPRRPGRYRNVATTEGAPDLPSGSIQVLEKHGSIPFPLSDLSCAFNLYLVGGQCKDPSSFLTGWNGKVELYTDLRTTSVDLGGRTSAWDSDEAVQNGLDVTATAVYAVGELGFGVQAAAAILTETLDACYGGNVQCGDCGTANDGTQRLYAVTKSDGTTNAAKVVYSTDGGATWNSSAITGITLTELPVAIRVVNDRIVVATQTAGGATLSGYYHAPLSTAGVPGTWVKVSAGFVATKLVTDMHVASAREIYFSAQGGYIYRSTDIASGVSVLTAGDATSVDLSRIHGVDDVLVAVGTGTVLVSLNRGATWGTTLTAPDAGAINALAVLDDRRYWVGTAGGNVLYTLDGGETWRTLAFSGSGAGAVHDIVFVTKEVGYISHATTTPTARLFSTWNGGADWTNAAPRIGRLPVFSRANRIAVPLDAHATIASNNILLAGLAGGGTDGMLLQGKAPIL